MKTSIIICAFDNFKWQRHITLACLNNLRRFTDEAEVILVDTGTLTGQGGPYNRWGIIKPDKHLIPGDIGVSAAFNLGAENAEGEILVFMHNDVFVWEGWLKAMISELEDGKADVIYPDQIARERSDVLDIYTNHHAGHDEAGMYLLKKTTWQTIGGWDADLKAVYQDDAFQKRLRANGFTWYCTTKTLITHIGSVTYAYDTEIERANMDRDGKTLQEKYGRAPSN